MLKSATADGFAAMGLLIRSFQVSRMLEVAASLELADRIDDKPRQIRELAGECSADAAMLLRLCRALAAFGIFTVDPEGQIGHSENSRWLRKDSKPTLHHAVRYWMMPSTWAVWGNLEHAIRTGEPPLEAIYGMPYFDYLKTQPGEARLFDNFMQNSPDDRHAAVVEAYDFSEARLVVDVGGGNGALLAAILEANPRTRGVLLDQVSVLSSANLILGTLAERCIIHPGSFFDSLPTGGDVYTLSQILHDWNDERCRDILANCRAAMDKEGRLLVIERVLDTAPGQSNPMNFLSDMTMMLLFPGARERTPAEFAQLFRDVGFSEPRVI
jgi:O-methyltransferase domain